MAPAGDGGGRQRRGPGDGRVAGYPCTYVPGAGPSGGYLRLPSAARARFSSPEREVSHPAHLGHHEPSCPAAVESHRSGSAPAGGASQYPYLAVFAGLTKDWMWPDLTTTMSLRPLSTWVAP